MPPAAATPASKRLAIFRAGKHVSVDGRAVEFSADAVKQIADSYDPASLEAPLVVGHPKTDNPAYGWVKSLSVDTDGTLYAEPQQVEPQFAELVNDGRFKRVSASIYLPDTPGNPKPGQHYLKHVGFLGAAAPAVKGMPVPQFAENDAALEFADDEMATPEGIGAAIGRLLSRATARDAAAGIAELITPEQRGDPAAHFAEREAAEASAREAQRLAKEQAMSDEKKATEFAERETALNTREQAIQAREAALKEGEGKKAREDAVHFAEQLVNGGQILPKDHASVVELQVALGGNAEVSFAEGDTTVKKAPLELLKGLLAALPKQVDFAEKSGAQVAAEAAAVEFAAPPGAGVDATRLELHNKAKAYQAKHPNASYSDAVKAVGG